MQKEFFRDKRVLITGHTGFKGTWLTLLLKEMGARICGYSLPVERNSFYAEADLSIDRHVEGDITEYLLIKTIEEFRPEIIIHLASHSSLKESDKIPDFIFQTNLMGVVNLFEGIRKVDCVKSVLIITSDKCYKNIETDIPYTEASPLEGQEPYSTSKVCQELITDCYKKTFFEYKTITNIATARASNVIGGGDYNQTRLMPYLLKQFTNGTQAVIRSPKAIRPWQNILDVLYGYLLLAEKLYLAEGNEYSQAFNFGPGEDGFRTVGQVVESLANEFEYSKYEYIEADTTKIETNILKLNSEKAISMLEWKIRYSFEETLKMTADFAKRHMQGEKVNDICLNYIRKYVKEVEADVK